MSWPCRLVDLDELRQRGEGPGPGDMWFAPQMLDGDHAEYFRRHILSPEYLRDWASKRPPLMVCLPNGTWFNVDSKVTDGEHGWTVTGEPPQITVSPSINIVGLYHGWIRDGVITDDCEGRLF